MFHQQYVLFIYVQYISFLFPCEISFHIRIHYSLHTYNKLPLVIHLPFVNYSWLFSYEEHFIEAAAAASEHGALGTILAVAVDARDDQR